MADNKRKSISKKTRFEVFKRDNFTCQYCGKSAPDVILEIDHINPVKNGGDNNIMNLVTSCFDCNRGKGKRKLTENEEMKLQIEQLKEINQKREQLEMLLQWKIELEKFDEEQVDKIEEMIFKEMNTSFTEYGRNNFKKLIKKYGFEDVYESTKISIEKYYNFEDEDSTNKVINYVPKICFNRKKDKEKPELYKINYLCKIAKNNLSYFDNVRTKIFLSKYFKEEQFEDVKYIFILSKNWTDLREGLEDYYGEDL